MKKFRCDTYFNATIKQVEVERETDSSVWVNGLRSSKITNYHSYFDTWGDAHDHMMKDAEQRLEMARNELQRAQGRHGNVKGMKPPQD